MKIQRRLLAALLITLSCLLAIQPAGAVTASTAANLNQLCADTQSLPDNFPSWLKAQLLDLDNCALADADVDLRVTGTVVDVCSQIGPTVFNLGLGSGSASPVMMNVPACLSPEVAGSGDLDETNVVRVPIEGSIVAMNETSAYESNVAITGGVNESSVVQVPTEVYIMTVRDQSMVAVDNESNVAQVPTEVYIMTVRDQPVALVDDEEVAGAPDQLRGQPSNIGPTI